MWLRWRSKVWLRTGASKIYSSEDDLVESQERKWKADWGWTFSNGVQSSTAPGDVLEQRKSSAVGPKGYQPSIDPSPSSTACLQNRNFFVQSLAMTTAFSSRVRCHVRLAFVPSLITIKIINLKFDQWARSTPVSYTTKFIRYEFTKKEKKQENRAFLEGSRVVIVNFRVTNPRDRSLRWKRKSENERTH